jgi:manganese transport protein
VFAPLIQGIWPALRPAPAGDVPLALAGSREWFGGRGDRPTPGLAPLASYRRVALALELGGGDREAVRFLRASSFASGATLLLVHVAESAASRFLGIEASDAETREDQLALENLALDFAALGVQVEICLLHGDPASEIQRIVTERDVDLLVTGGHGHGAIRDLIYGSTVAAVRHRVNCPVLSVPTPRR